MTKTDGTTLCWGTRPGDSPTPTVVAALAEMLTDAPSLASRITAPDVAGLSDVSFVQVSSAEDHSCGITTDDRVKCWEGTHASVDVPLP